MTISKIALILFLLLVELTLTSNDQSNPLHLLSQGNNYQIVDKVKISGKSEYKKEGRPCLERIL